AQLIIGFADPLTATAAAQAVAARGARLVAMELVPRITRAQSMDALSSMATIVGYKAVLLAANTLPRMFPMLNTAAGTVAAARLDAADVRPAVKQQIRRRGAWSAEVPLDAADAQRAGGYAKVQDEAFYQRQRALLHKTVATSDVVSTTAAIPGRCSTGLGTGA